MTDSLVVLREAFEEIEAVLLSEYADGRLFLEADLQAIVYAHLRKQLKGREWVIRCEPPFHNGTPDLAVFHIPDKENFSDFLGEPLDYLAAAIELKHASGLRSDLKKLRRLQRRNEVLCWMVYSDHFSQEINQRNVIIQEKRRDEIEEWVSDRESHRGATIARLDLDAPRNEGDQAFITGAFAKSWWARTPDRPS